MKSRKITHHQSEKEEVRVKKNVRLECVCAMCVKCENGMSKLISI